MTLIAMWSQVGHVTTGKSPSLISAGQLALGKLTMMGILHAKMITVTTVMGVTATVKLKKAGSVQKAV